MTKILESAYYTIHGRIQDFGSEAGNIFEVGLLGGPGAEPSGAGKFSKIFKKLLKKIAKNALF